MLVMQRNVMKRLSVICGLVTLCSLNAFGIGDQHGLFRSQSTQGKAWTGTAVIEKESYRMTVYPDYLDVELDWTFRVSGEKPAEHEDALEIVGNINLVSDAVVVGLITWWKGDILKGKLKTEADAREAYEEVVDRDAEAPPPPRDPVLLEYGWGKDNYDLSIFPVTFGETRRVRIRYLVPAYSAKGVNRILYPHAFTDSAEVSIRAGSGVVSYDIETERNIIPYLNRDFEMLNPEKFTFMPWGGSGERISHLIPRLSETDAKGSILYTGEISTPSIGGQMVHVTTMTGREAISRAGLPEDYVILWRWNHPEILALYARQIVEQSKLLKQFIERVSEANKRVALVVDKQGEERITFRLSAKDDATYQEMLSYLDQQAGRAIVDPPQSTTKPNYDIPIDAEAAFAEFEQAIRAAMDLFDEDGGTIRHLLLLTAGPVLITRWFEERPITLDSTISISLLADFTEGKELDMETPESAKAIYWPGVNTRDMFVGRSLDVTVTATLSTGSREHRVKVLAPPEDENSYIGEWVQTQDHVFTENPLERSITWTVAKGESVLAEFIEVPRVVAMDDGMQYARLLGASPYLTPRASARPRSMAATFGFVDTAYSLVALEEDKLPAEIAAEYEHEGVPLLSDEDIFSAEADRQMIEVDEWLKLNPPQPMGGYSGGNRWGGGFQDPFMDWLENAPVVKRNDTAEVGLNPDAPAMPRAERIDYSGVSQTYDDYSSALATRSPSTVALKSRLSAFLMGRALRVQFPDRVQPARGTVNIVLYDMSGRKLAVWNRQLEGRVTQVMLPIDHLSRGSYLLRISGIGAEASLRLLIP